MILAVVITLVSVMIGLIAMYIAKKYQRDTMLVFTVNIISSRFMVIDYHHRVSRITY